MPRQKLYVLMPVEVELMEDLDDEDNIHVGSIRMPPEKDVLRAIKANEHRFPVSGYENAEAAWAALRTE